MNQTTGYYIVKQKALPEVLLKVVEAKRLIDSEKVLTVQEAADQVGISRSSFYKYKMLHPILITTLLFYTITFFINPIVAHRFSPYVFFALLLFPFDKIKNEKMVLLVNKLTIVLFPIFVYSLFNAHRTESFRDIFIR